MLPCDAPHRPAGSLPEEIIDDVDHLSRPGVDENRIVPIADPARAGRSVGQAVLPRVVDPIIARIIARPHPPSGAIGLIAPAERIVVKAELEQPPIFVAVLV